VTKLKPGTQTTSHLPLAQWVQNTPCPACAHQVAVNFFDGGKHPLSILAWPKTETEAKTIERLPLDFVRCVDCGHVYNRSFTYDKVPYSEKPNLMFNTGKTWQDHLITISQKILDRLPENPVVVEIGCGDGHLLHRLAEARPDGIYIGFEPSGALVSKTPQVIGRAEYFDPAIHLAEIKPDMIISRHVMEHLTNPVGFLQSIAFAASWNQVDAQLFIEVPCIDRVFKTVRTADFFYEHNSHFTTHSLKRMLQRCAKNVEGVSRSYSDEVVYGFAKLNQLTEQLMYAQEAVSFHEKANQGIETIQVQVDDLAKYGGTVAIWGGTGKSSTFINRYSLDAERFPLVVDSDREKVGTFVPGSGQVIQFSDILKSQKTDTIIITSQWRAKDIYLEIQEKNIPYTTLLIEYQGRLVNFLEDRHPYHPKPTQFTSKPTQKLPTSLLKPKQFVGEVPSETGRYRITAKSVPIAAASR
jgi:SAM-dependent methyltransferase